MSETPQEQPTYAPPATQEDLNRIIADRVSRERAKYADYADLKSKAAEYDKVQESAKTEMQKLTERAEAAERRVAEFESRDQVAEWAKEITKDSPVPPEALRGSTREDLQAHFDQLNSFIAPPATTDQTPKGLVGPYVPSEGGIPSGAAMSAGQLFADFIQRQTG